MLTIPNLLTASRLFLAPFVAWRLWEHDVEGAFWLFLAAAVTDLLDGYLARLLRQQSAFGAMLDPVADKVMLLTCLTFLSLTGLLPMWLLWLLLIRDSGILLGVIAYRRLTGQTVITPIFSGKLAIALEFILVSWVLAEDGLLLGLAWGIEPLTWLTAMAAAFSALRYLWLWGEKTHEYLRDRKLEK